MYARLSNTSQSYYSIISKIFQLLAIIGSISLVEAATVGDPLFRIHEPTYAFLDCSACIAFAGHLGRRMNESIRYGGRGGATFLSSHRLGKDNKLKRRDYATSELRGAEVLEKICNDSLFDDYALHFRADMRIRVYDNGESEYPLAQHYSKEDSRILKAVKTKAVHVFCTRVMDEEEDAMTSLVREVELLSELEQRLCGGYLEMRNITAPPFPVEKAVTAVCVGVEPSIEAEVRRLEKYEKWQASISKGTSQDKMKGAEGAESVVVKGVQYSKDDPLSFTVLRKPNAKSNGDTTEGGSDAAEDVRKQPDKDSVFMNFDL
ncbi:TLR4 regulator and MIR-interacting MSAP, putative [Trypanosoma equiperdum]|uniref:DUF3456 domain-containing protein n=2 Tax=Trypanozoon TaxID=39700 RepID=Q381R4_TRYB2|nr:hypothetical protein, conserved [Trypanosoma brucei brucei TREU927]EAN80467.1 hypothetical protein, conserved [Trypanosoma brucei brucei TREU927]SCU69793.1 TLR4 regulator and MIR-interacting MSAP, putative [Trypanosoma equiperdum]